VGGLRAARPARRFVTRPCRRLPRACDRVRGALLDRRTSFVRGGAAWPTSASADAAARRAAARRSMTRAASDVWRAARTAEAAAASTAARGCSAWSGTAGSTSSPEGARLRGARDDEERSNRHADVGRAERARLPHRAPPSASECRPDERAPGPLCAPQRPSSPRRVHALRLRVVRGLGRVLRPSAIAVPSGHSIYRRVGVTSMAESPSPIPVPCGAATDGRPPTVERISRTSLRTRLPSDCEAPTLCA
jgi:hypothetical protein